MSEINCLEDAVNKMIDTLRELGFKVVTSYANSEEVYKIIDLEDKTGTVITVSELDEEFVDEYIDELTKRTCGNCTHCHEGKCDEGGYSEVQVDEPRDEYDCNAWKKKED
ncbi:MAG: hypothetical protein WC307_06025 [Candidatus Nanoarchaeia archaeon]|jgi:biotin operon repressor